MKTTGSISVERAAKPLKNKVAEKSRNRNSKDKRTVLLRVGLNLRLKRESLEAVKAALGKVVDLEDDALVYKWALWPGAFDSLCVSPSKYRLDHTSS